MSDTIISEKILADLAQYKEMWNELRESLPLFEVFGKVKCRMEVMELQRGIKKEVDLS